MSNPRMPSIRSGLTVLAGALALGVLTTDASAQRTYDQDKMKANLEKKLEKDFVSNAPWKLDLAEAKAEAKKSGKLIFAYFTRSYAN
ncbi:MAG: hypothetical protein KAI24_19665 [Planctomycetes bacterium]|nr:hypothetical protein [Planctomycetota bacterium]